MKAEFTTKRILTEKRSYKSFLGKTWEQVQELMSAFLGECVEESDCLRLFSDVFLEWLGIHKYNIKESTLSNYRTKANKHILPFFHMEVQE